MKSYDLIQLNQKLLYTFTRSLKNELTLLWHILEFKYIGSQLNYWLWLRDYFGLCSVLRFFWEPIPCTGLFSTIFVQGEGSLASTSCAMLCWCSQEACPFLNRDRGGRDRGWALRFRYYAGPCHIWQYALRQYPGQSRVLWLLHHHVVCTRFL